jgi:hypothetical protein
MTGGPHPSAAGGGRAREAGRLGRWRLLGWPAGGDARTRVKNRGPRADFAVLGQQANGPQRRGGSARLLCG